VSRSGSFAYMEVGKGRERDCMDAGGRAPKGGALGDAGAVAEERKLRLKRLLWCRLLKTHLLNTYFNLLKYNEINL